jgi:hypothetical protein
MPRRPDLDPVQAELLADLEASGWTLVHWNPESGEARLERYHGRDKVEEYGDDLDSALERAASQQARLSTTPPRPPAAV